MRISFRLQAARPRVNKMAPYPPLILIRCSELGKDEEDIVTATYERGIVNFAFTPDMLKTILETANDTWKDFFPGPSAPIPIIKG